MSAVSPAKLALIYGLLTLGDYVTTFLGLSMGLKELHPYTLNPIVMTLRLLVFSALAFHRLGKWATVVSIPILCFTVIHNLWVIAWSGTR